MLRRLTKRGEIVFTVRHSDGRKTIHRSADWLPNGKTFAEVLGQLTEAGSTLDISIIPDPARVFVPFTTGNKALDRLSGDQLVSMETREAVTAAQFEVRGIGFRFSFARDIKLTVAAMHGDLVVAEVADVDTLLITPEGTVIIWWLRSAAEDINVPAVECLTPRR